MSRTALARRMYTGDKRHYAGVSISASSNTISFTVTTSAFDPVLPVGTTTVPVIELIITRVETDYPGNTSGSAHNMSVSSGAGSPFSGTIPFEGYFKNVAINDKINISTGGNASGSVGGTFQVMLVAVMQE